MMDPIVCFERERGREREICIGVGYLEGESSSILARYVVTSRWQMEQTKSGLLVLDLE